MRFRAPAALVALLSFAACSRDVDVTKPIARPPATSANAVGVDPVTGAIISTSKDDYNPGEMVHVTGRGWAPNETVHLAMTEDPDTHPDVAMDVTADATGAFSVHFYDVQEYDRGVTFTLTATGAVSHSSATAVFTDTRILTLFEIQNPGTGAFVAAPGPVTVSLGATFTIRATGTTDVAPPGFGSGIDDWESTFWQIRGPAPSTNIVVTGCSNTINVTSPTVGAQHVFSVPVPAVEGTYSVDIRAFQIDGCFANPSNVLTYASGMIVSVAPPNTVPAVDAGADASINEGGTFSQSGSFVDPDANAWTATVDYGDGSGVQALALSAKTFSLSHAYADNGNFTVTVSVNDGTATGTDQVAVHVDNAAPTATLGAPAGVHVGTPFVLSLTSPVDPSSADVAAGLQYAFDCGDGAGYGALGSASTRSCPTSALGSRSAKGKIRDKDGGQSEYGASVAVTNGLPVVSAGGPYTGNEGAVIAIAATASDPDGTIASTTWSVSPACSIANASAASTTVTCPDNGSYTLTMTARDNDGATSAANASLTVKNVAPVISAVSMSPLGTASVYGVSQTITVQATYADAGVPDTHTCSAVATAGGVTVSGSSGQGSGTNPNRSCSSSLTLAQAGVYDVALTVTDDDGGTAAKSVEVVVSDPSAGFVTAGGWIDSPAGAYVANAGLRGKATFGIVAKYKKDSWLPEGSTQFDFHAGNFTFRSDGYTYLVINPSGTGVQFEGTGTVNGVGQYGFMVSMTDGTTDTFRMKVWNASTGDVVYDTQPNASDSATPTAPVNGSIVIHTKN
jgi:hypothetical protein